MNKTHIAGAGMVSGFLAAGLAAFFPHANLTPEQVAFIVGVLPTVGMGLLAAVEVLFPKTKPVVEAVQAAVEAPKA